MSNRGTYEIHISTHAHEICMSIYIYIYEHTSVHLLKSENLQDSCMQIQSLKWTFSTKHKRVHANLHKKKNNSYIKYIRSEFFFPKEVPNRSCSYPYRIPREVLPTRVHTNTTCSYTFSDTLKMGRALIPTKCPKHQLNTTTARLHIGTRTYICSYMPRYPHSS